MRTYQQTTAETRHDWYLVEPAGQRLGVLPVRVARALSGRHKPTWTPHIDDGDHVVVINAAKIELSGKKLEQKLYRRHSQYPGSLKTETAGDVLEKHPERLIERAGRGMPAPNTLRAILLGRLKVYPGGEPPPAPQQPKALI